MYETNPQRFISDDVIARIADIAAYHSQALTSAPIKRAVLTDIHGMDKKLLDMLEYVTEKCREVGETRQFVFMGDYVDRGPGSAQVVAMVRLFQEVMPAGFVVALKGNHEDMLIDKMRFQLDESYYFSATGQSFARNGGNCLPPRDAMEWMQNLGLYFEDAKHYYVHAGIRPCVPIEKQVKSDLIWIREEFLRFNPDHRKYVLHGHTPNANIDLRPNRCGIDTGACFEDEFFLTCAEVDESVIYPVGFYQVNKKHRQRMTVCTLSQKKGKRVSVIKQINEQVRLQQEAENAMMARHPVNLSHEELALQRMEGAHVEVDETPVAHDISKPKAKTPKAVANTVNTAVSNVITANT